MVATGGKPLRPAHRDLVEDTWPATLYLIVPPSHIKPLVRLILNRIDRRLTEELQKAAAIGCLRDEFPAIGRLDFFESTLAFIAG